MAGKFQEVEHLYDWGYHLVAFVPRVLKQDKRIPKHRDYIRTRPTKDQFAQMGVCDWAIIPTTTCVLDLEIKDGKDGHRDLCDFAAKHSTTYEELTNGCPVVRTQSGGLHIWYRQPVGAGLRGGFYLFGAVEAKAGNGAVHIPPSLGYSFISPLCAPTDAPELPACLQSAWTNRCTERSGSKLYEAASFGIGDRRAGLLSIAGKLREAGLTETELSAALLAVRDNRCEQPESFGDDEVIGIARDISRKEIRSLEGAAMGGDPYAQAAISFFSRGRGGR